jgi:hypothetical protein
VQVGRVDAHAGDAAFGDAHGDVAADAADLALEVAHAGLARVVADDRQQRLVGDLALLGRQAVAASWRGSR